MPVFFLVGGYANALSWRSARAPRRDVCRVAARAAASPPRARGAAPARLARRRVRRVRGGGARAARCARHPRWRWCRPGSSRPTSSCAPWRPRRSGCGSASAGGRSSAGSLLGGLVDLVSLGDRHARGRLRQLPRRVGDACTSSGTRGSTGGSPAPGAGWRWPPSGSSALRGAGVGRALPGVDDRPRRRRREQLLPDAGHPRRSSGCSRPASCSPLEPLLARWMPRPGPGRRPCCVNTRIMTLYLWHLTAMVAVIGASLLLGGFGLGVEPLTWPAGG